MTADTVMGARLFDKTDELADVLPAALDDDKDDDDEDVAIVEERGD